jgi:hypothetical protein
MTGPENNNVDDRWRVAVEETITMILSLGTVAMALVLFFSHLM